MEKSFKITLADGTQLENLSLNGDNFVSEKEIIESTFEGNLSSVTIEGTSEEGNSIKEVHENMELLKISKYNDLYYFVIRDIPEAELEKMKMQADIEYLAMMSEIDLEEE